MKKRLVALGVMDESGDAAGQGAESLYAIYRKAEGDTRGFQTLSDEATKKISELAERGFDLGPGRRAGLSGYDEGTTRIDAIYTHARRALYARLNDRVITEVSPRRLRVRTRASSRDDYLAHPPAGEAICGQDAARVSALYPAGRPRVQIVVSDGLNANALNETLRFVLPALRRQLVQAGHDLGNVDIVIENGRVRAGYHVGLLLDLEIVIHLIGERPGTGIDTTSAYVTYGRDSTGRSRWDPSFDHSLTTAVCGIHQRGKRPDVAVEEIARLVNRMFEQRCSGVTLR